MKKILPMLSFMILFLSHMLFAEDNPQIFGMKESNIKNPEGSKPILFWGNYGVGASNVGVSAVLSASLQFNRNLISTRFIGSGPLFIVPDSGITALYDVGILYGRVLERSKFGFVSIAAGISYLDIDYLDIYSVDLPSLHVQTIGIPIEIQLFLTSKWIGAGIYGFANLNLEQPVIGAAISLQFGKLRSSYF